MKRLLLALLLVASPVRAGTFWVAPSAADGGIGVGTGTRADSTGSDTTAGHAKTLAWFNANALKGDICRFKSGTYSDPIQPSKAGTAGQRIYYYGFPQDPQGVRVANIILGTTGTSGAPGSYVTVKWCKTTSGFTGIVTTPYSGIAATNDSIVACRGISNNGIGWTGDHNTFDSLTVTGTVTQSGQTGYLNGYQILASANDAEPQYYVTANRFTNSTLTVTVNIPSGDFMMVRGGFDSLCVIEGNTFNTTVTACQGYCFLSELYHSGGNTIRSNTWNWTTNGAIGGTTGGWSQRNAAGRNRYTQNTINFAGSGTAMTLRLTNPGNTAFNGLAGHSYFGHNTIRSTATSLLSSLLYYYDACNTDTLEFNEFYVQSTQPVLTITSGVRCDSLLFRHNTCYAGGGSVFSLTGATIGTGNQLTSNVFYGAGTNAFGSETVRLPSGVGIDSIGVLYSAGAGSTAARGLSVGGTGGTPGVTYGVSGSATFANPLFVSTTYPPNLSLGSGSPAASGSSVWDGYAGAYGTSPITNYSITVVSGAHGSVSPFGVRSVASGGSLQINITPLPGYDIASITVDGVVSTNPNDWQQNQYSFSSVAANHRFSVAFYAITYHITASAGSGGAISPTGMSNHTVAEGSIVYAITPNASRAVLDVTVNGVSQGPISSFEFQQIDTDYEIIATFYATATNYTITANGGPGGTITPLGATSVASAGSQAYTITPLAGFHRYQLLVDGALTDTTDTYTFSNVAANHTIVATFTSPDLTLTTFALTPGGLLFPSGIHSVTPGTNQSVAIEPSSGYQIDNVTVDGVARGVIRRVNFPGMTASHTVSASFKVGAQYSGGQGSPSRRRFR